MEEGREKDGEGKWKKIGDEGDDVDICTSSTSKANGRPRVRGDPFLASRWGERARLRRGSLSSQKLDILLRRVPNLGWGENFSLSVSANHTNFQ